MIACGVDGLSQGDKESGIALGHDLRDFLPLSVSAFDAIKETFTWSSCACPSAGGSVGCAEGGG